MSRVLPILFNTDMVRAILDGRKTVTRRVLKHPFEVHQNGFITKPKGNERLCPYEPPYQPGDILYVRETWSPVFVVPRRYLYKVGCKEAENLPIKWHPSIHMPKEAARIWLKVTNVWVERLQEIDGAGILSEGVDNGKSNPTMGIRWENMQREAFKELWHSTIKKSDIDRYGWDANPWVWVIEFERCEELK